MSSVRARSSSRPPPPAWKPPPLPDDPNYDDYRKRYSRNLSHLDLPIPTICLDQDVGEAKLNSFRSELLNQSIPTQKSPNEGSGQSYSQLGSNKSEHDVDLRSKPTEKPTSGNVTKNGKDNRPGPDIGTSIRPKMSPKPEAKLIEITKPLAKESSTLMKEKDEVSNFPGKKISTGTTESSTSSTKSTPKDSEVTQTGVPLRRFGRTPTQPETESPKSWGSRQTIKGQSVPAGSMASPKIGNETIKNPTETKPSWNKAEQKVKEEPSPEVKVEGSKGKEDSQKSTINGHQSTNPDNKRSSFNHKNFEEVSNVLRSRLKEKSISTDPLSGMTRIDQCLLIASSSNPIRSPRFTELNVKCLVRTSCGIIPDQAMADIESFDVVLNQDKVLNTESLEKEFDKIADVIHMKENSGGVVLIQAISETGTSNKPRKLKLFGKENSADSDALAGTLCVAYLLKHRKLPIESALEIIKARRDDMKPTSALTLALLEYEKKLKNGTAGSLKSRFNLRRFTHFMSQNWIIIIIIFLVILIIFKSIHEGIKRYKEVEEEEELVCY